jgi:hypothetical protein
MRPSRPAPVLLVSLLLLVACAPAGSGGTPTQTPSPGSLQPGATATPVTTGTPGATPAFTTGPSGTPIGTWSLTLVGGPIAGEYGGQDEMICVGLAGDPSVPISVVFQPASSPPLQQVNATTSEGGSILVIGGGIETAANYLSESATVVEASIDAAGIVHLSVTGTQRYPGEPGLRQMSFVGACPLFPADEEG